MVRSSKQSLVLANLEEIQFLHNQILNLQDKIDGCVIEIIKQQRPRIKQELERNKVTLQKKVDSLKEELYEKQK